MSKRDATDDELAPEPKSAAILPWPKIPGIKTEEEVNEDRSLSEYRKIVQILRTVTEVKPASATVVIPNIRDVSHILSDPVVPGRDFYLKRHGVKGGKYEWIIEDRSSPKFFTSPEKNIKVPIAIMSGLSATVARRTANKVIDVLKRWTFPWENGQGDRTIAGIVRSCLPLVIYGHVRHYVPHTKSQPRRTDEMEYHVRIPYIDRTTGKRESYKLLAKPATTVAAEIPAIPSHVEYFNPATDYGVLDKVPGPDGTMCWPAVVPVNISERDTREAHEKVARYYQYMAYIFTDTLTTEKEIKTVQASVSSSIGVERKGELQINQSLYTV
jgi:hypothetical protein